MSLNSKTDDTRLNGNANIGGMRKAALNSASDGHTIWTANGTKYSSFSSTSSQINPDGEYSCDPTINAYVVATKDSNQNISRADLAKLPEDFVRPVFRGLTSENKVRIFTEKINLLISTESLTNEEIAHLRLALSFLKPECYNSENSFVNSFIEKWTKYAMSNFNWSKDKIGMYIASIYSPSEIALIRMSNNHMHSGERGRGDGGGPMGCNCNGGDDYCSQGKCSKGGCGRSSWGCGTFFAGSCNGLCVWQASLGAIY